MLEAALDSLGHDRLRRRRARGLALTPAGSETFGRLTRARDDALRELVADWEPEGGELDAVIDELARELELRRPRAECSLGEPSR